MTSRLLTAQVLHDVLRKAFDDVRAAARADRVQTTLQMLWADELLENQSQMQTDLQASADLFVAREGTPATDLTTQRRVPGRSPARVIGILLPARLAP